MFATFFFNKPTPITTSDIAEGAQGFEGAKLTPGSKTLSHMQVCYIM